MSKKKEKEDFEDYKRLAKQHLIIYRCNLCGHITADNFQCYNCVKNKL